MFCNKTVSNIYEQYIPYCVLIFPKSGKKFGQLQSKSLVCGKCLQCTMNYRENLQDAVDKKIPFLLHLAYSAPGTPLPLTSKFVPDFRSSCSLFRLQRPTRISPPPPAFFL